MQQFKEVTLNTYYLYKETIIEGEKQYQQGQLDQINKLIAAVQQQEKDGFKYAQMFQLLKEQKWDNEIGLNFGEVNDYGKRVTW